MFMTGCAGHKMKMKMPSPHKLPQVTNMDYRIFDTSGNPAYLKDIVSAADQADVVFIGEEHGDPVGHHLESRLLEMLFDSYDPSGKSKGKRQVLLSMEMFERDTQIVLDEYLSDLITERHFIKAARAWPNYRWNYRTMVELAKKLQ